uniref:Zinc finger protein n=1 Tax=Ciona intestinalis TaxID=7719 RepID=F6YB82_CIOIN
FVKMSSRSFRASSDRKVYVGNLGTHASREDLEEEFSYYGRLDSVWVARNPPGFAYVLFEDARDAKDAVRGLDGKIICDRKVRVDISNSRSTGRPARRGPAPYDSDMRCYNCSETGHFARDCPRSRGVGRRRRSRSYSRSRSRSRSYSKSRSRSPRRKRSRRSRSRSTSSAERKSRSPRKSSREDRRRRTRSDRSSRSRSKSEDKKGSRSRSRSRDKDRKSRSRSKSVEYIEKRDSRSRSRSADKSKKSRSK